MAAIEAQAGPSRPRKSTPASTEPVEPNQDVDDPRQSVQPTATGPAGQAGGEEGDEDEERMDLKAIESMAKYVLDPSIGPVRRSQGC